MTEQERLAAVLQMQQAYQQEKTGIAPSPYGSYGGSWEANPTITSPDGQGGTTTQAGNPYQWGSDDMSKQVQEIFGGTPWQQSLESPGGAYSSPQNMLNINGNNLNTGLMGDLLAKYGGAPGSSGMETILRDMNGGYTDADKAGWAAFNANRGYAPNPNFAPGANPNRNTSQYYDRYAANQASRQANGATAPRDPAKPLSFEEFQAQQSGGSGTVNRQTDRTGRSSSSSGSYYGSSRDRDERGGTSEPLAVSGLTRDLNDSYSGTTTLSANGQPVRIAVLPDGRIFNDTGQEITSAIEPGQRSAIIGAFQSQASDPNFQPSGAPINREPIDSRGQTDAQARAAYEEYMRQYNTANPTSPSAPAPSGSTPPPSSGSTPPPSYGSPAPSYRTPVPGPSTGSPGYPRQPNGAPPDQNYPGSQSPAQSLRYRTSGAGWGDPYNNPYYGGTAPFLGRGDGQDIDLKAENDRALAIQGGDRLQQDFKNYTDYNQGQASDYEDRLNAAYGPISRGEGGYSSQEKDSILNNDALQRLQQTQGEADSNYLTDDEQGQITGNPWAAIDQLSADEQGMDADRNARNSQVRSSLDRADTGVRGALDSQDANVRNAYGQSAANQRATLGGMAQNVRGAYQDSAANIRDTLNYGEDNARSYLGRDRLGLSQDYLDNYHFTDRDQQDIVDRAGRSVGQQNQSNEDRLLRDASAAGNTSPLALEAARSRLRQQGGQTAAGALQDARISARQLGLQTTQNRENTRLGAEQNYAQLGTGTELALGARRTAAEQGLGEQAQGNERYLGSAALGMESGLGAAAQGAEQYLGNQRSEAEKHLGTQRTGAEQELGAAGMAQGQWKTGTNLGAFQAVDKTRSDRAAQIAQNRQATNQGNQATQYARGQYIYGQGQAANKGFADERLKQEGEYRNYLGAGKESANQNVGIGNQQRLGAYSAQNQGTSSATNNAIQNYSVPGLWKSIADTAIGAVKGKHGLIEEDGPQQALIGEAGPEYVVDLDKVKPMAVGGGPYTPPGYDDEGTYGEGTMPLSAESGLSGAPGAPQQPQQKPNPLWAAIRKSASRYAGLDQQAGGGGLYQEPPKQNQGGGSALGGIASLFMADGGVVAPGIELVTEPEIRTLGAKHPQAVVPLTKRPGNKVNMSDIPALAMKYGGYGACNALR